MRSSSVYLLLEKQLSNNRLVGGVCVYLSTVFWHQAFVKMRVHCREQEETEMS